MRPKNFASVRSALRMLLCALLLSSAACGMSTVTGLQEAQDSNAQTAAIREPDQSSIARSVTGHPLLVYSAIFVQGTSASGWPYVGVVLADAPSLCDSLTQGKVPARMTNMAFTFASLGQGAYDVGSDVNKGEVLVAYNQSDATCHNSLNPSLSAAHSGQVQVSNLDLNSRLHGSFNVQMNAAGESVNGTFVAVECPAAIKLFDCSSALVCQ